MDDYSGRLSKVIYPEDFAINYSYDRGFLDEIRKDDDNSLIWQLEETTPLLAEVYYLQRMLGEFVVLKR